MIKAINGLAISIAIILLGAECYDFESEEKDYDKFKIRNVSITAINSTTIHVTWEIPKQFVEYECSNKKFSIRLKVDGSKKSRTWKVGKSRSSVSLHDLLPNTVYFLRVLAMGCDNRGKPSKWIQIQTSEQSTYQEDVANDSSEISAPGKPVYLRTRTYVDAVMVSWLPPEEDTAIRGYMIGYGEGVPDVNWQYVDEGRRNVTIKNLKPATQYIISLRAFNNAGKGPVVYDLIYTREKEEFEFSQSSTPREVKASVLSPTTAWLQWIDPSLGSQQRLTDSRYYNVHYRPLPNGQMLSVIVKALHIVLYDLTPGKTYEFKIRTIKESISSDFSEIARNTTFETAPSSPPRNLTIAYGDILSTVIVLWLPPEHPNGNITGYTIYYTQDVYLPIEKWSSHEIKENVTKAVVFFLIQDRTYYFKIQAKNSKGRSPLSDYTIHHTQYRYNTIDSDLSIHGKLEESDEQKNEFYDKDAPIDEENVFQMSLSEPGKEQLYLEKQDDNKDSIKPRSAALTQLNDVFTDNKKSPPEFSGADNSISRITIQFRSVVQHQLTAYISWPEYANGCESKKLYGYRFHYWVAKNPQQANPVRVVEENFVVLTNLLPGVVYEYQVQYMEDEYNNGPWSQTQTMDTSST